MRIFILLPGLPIGGMERAAVTLANALAMRHHDVTLATYSLGDDPMASELDAKVRFIRKGLKPHPIMGRIPYIRHKFYDDGMWETRTTPEKLYKYYVGDERYDVEIAFFRGLSIKTLSAKRGKQRLPIRLAWVHNDFTKAIGWNCNFKDTEAVRRAYASYNQVICVSNQARQGFISTLGDTGNLNTIYNLLPIEDIRRKGVMQPEKIIPMHKFNIVIIGRLQDSHKGQCRLIDAVSDLQNKGIDIGLTLVGGGPDEELIERHIRDIRADGYVYSTGSQRNPYPYIKRADLLVCASYYEGYNLTVAESLILGTPVLSTRCTGPVEILDNGKYGMIVENSNESLKEGLHKLATDPGLLNHYKKMAVERRSFFDEEKIISQIEDLITR